MNALYLVATFVAEVDDGLGGYESGLERLGLVILVGALVLIAAVVCGAIGYSVGQDRGRRWEGMWLGLLLGPLGILVASRLRDTRPDRSQEQLDADELERLVALLDRGDITQAQFDDWRRNVLGRRVTGHGRRSRAVGTPPSE